MSNKPGAARAGAQRSKPGNNKRVELINSRVSRAPTAQRGPGKVGAHTALTSASPGQSAGESGSAGRAVQRGKKGRKTYRQARPLIATEEYAYMKQDLKTIGLLSGLMLILLLVLGMIFSGNIPSV
jgi:hypothetical protein